MCGNTEGDLGVEGISTGLGDLQPPFWEAKYEKFEYASFILQPQSTSPL